ncbi:FliI/YscN family ATPase [Bartonella sp. TP]|uniref:FliI/YscN family ATPase n=1 Tax=Bartonella sp. TP TaxID=3057550 RepID=UPI0025B0BB85|nr:FliI/YscN family ATPase [Bartonella sp. TP]WJW80563.1 FliI/YscN family ATPase [Bartonella sp. TP]
MAKLILSPDFKANLIREGGIVSEVSAEAIKIRGLSSLVGLGDAVVIEEKTLKLRAEVIRVAEDYVLVKSFDDTHLPKLGAKAFAAGALMLLPDISWRGRVLNSLGQPLDDLGPIKYGKTAVSVNSYAAPALKRGRIGESLATGVSALDIFTPMCFGQRMGIFAGSGVGKSTLLALMARADSFDTVVLALAGERGREVRDMLEDTMKDSMDKVVAIVSTGDESAMMRRLCPVSATSVAEYFSALGHKVLLIVDSITRYALAAREVAIAAQEPPVARGYPPSVFSQLSRLLERAGPGVQGSGSITGIYAVLIDGDDHNDPVADSIRGILDGHIVLDREIAAQGRFPAINLSSSISRLATSCWTADQHRLVQDLKTLILRYEESRDLRAMGAYKPGGDPILDQAVSLVPMVYQALTQNIGSPPVFDPYAMLAQTLKGES